MTFVINLKNVRCSQKFLKLPFTATVHSVIFLFFLKRTTFKHTFCANISRPVHDYPATPLRPPTNPLRPQRPLAQDLGVATLKPPGLASMFTVEG